MNDTIASKILELEGMKKLLSTGGQWLGMDATNLVSFIIFLVAVVLIVKTMALIGGLGTYAERKISADIQMRYGPNRVGPYGILQFLADGIKMITKEDILPTNSDKFMFRLAPILALVGVFATLAVVPFSSGIILTDLNVGVFYLLGVSSLVGVAVFLGGYSSNSKWSMLGGMRGASQIISYEVPVTLSILLIVLMAGGLSMGTVVENQGGWFHQWHIFHNPFAFLGFFVFFIGLLAETNRAPFDLPEAESELVSGYHTEYSGMRFAFFALAEYVEVFVLCGIASALFLGGYHIPLEGLEMESLWGKGTLQMLQLTSFTLKTLLLYYVVIWIRWTLPRLRVDQLMTICWKYLTPLALFNLIGGAFWMYGFQERSLWTLLMGNN